MRINEMKFPVGSKVQVVKAFVNGALYQLHTTDVAEVVRYNEDDSYPYIIQFDGRVTMSCLEEEIEFAEA